jgi:hypothetical protein
VSCAVFLAAAGDGGDWCRAAAILLPAAMLVAMMAPLLACLSRLVLVLLLAQLACCAATAAAVSEPNPPQWPPGVHIFQPGSDAVTQAEVNAAFATNGGRRNHGQFSQQRYALLFMPGSYDVEVPVGFYTQVMGLGATPHEVTFTSPKGVYCEEGMYTPSRGALDNFWRSAENFATDATFGWFKDHRKPRPTMLWAVSQASPLRRVVINANSTLALFQYVKPADGGGGAAGCSSGGFMADVSVGGEVASGSQQQFFSRNCAIQSWKGAV